MESFRVLIKENQIHEIMSQKSCSKKQITEKAIKRWLLLTENEIQ